MRGVLQILPTSNYAVASPSERADQMDALANRLMGLSHSVQLLGTSRETVDTYDWPTPPRLSRQWFAVVTADDQTTLDWRLRTLRSALEGVGLRCSETVFAEDCKPALDIQPAAVFDGQDWCATLVLRRWPREVAPGWLGQALSSDLPVDVALHIEPKDAQSVARWLKRQGAWQDDGGKDAGNALGKRDAEVTRQKLIARTDRPVKVAVVLTVRAPDRESLKRRVATLQHEISLALGDVRLAMFEQDRGLEATMPNGVCNLIGAYRTLDCSSVASTWIFAPATVNHTNGADLGTTHEGSMLVRLDPFDPSLESFGGIVVAKVGMGKSYLLKLLARRLENVEVLIVEQRTPAEYGSVPGAISVNLADVPMGERADHLRAFVSNLWETAKRDPKPRLLVLDELWSLLRDPALASLIEEIARIGRHHYLALWIATQQVRELLDGGQAVLDNAAIRIYLKQHDNDLEKLCDAVGLPGPARRFLRSAARGQALLDCGGLLVPVDIQATPMEHRSITTDPREKAHGTGMDRVEDHADAGGVRVGRGVAAVVLA